MKYGSYGNGQVERRGHSKSTFALKGEGVPKNAYKTYKGTGVSTGNVRTPM